jgi:P27 family predicted phage terminase small subunit
MGRPKLPTELKLLKGTLEKSRVLKDEMKPDNIVNIPYPPEWLGDVAKKEWYAITKELHKLKMLTNLDLSMLAVYCNEIQTYIECQEMIKIKTRVQIIKNPDGTLKSQNQSAYQRIANDSVMKAIKIASEFGLTPASRTRIGTAQIMDNDDPFVEFLKFK